MFKKLLDFLQNPFRSMERSEWRPLHSAPVGASIEANGGERYNFKKDLLFTLLLIPFALNGKIHYPPNVKQSDVVHAVDEGKVIMAWDIHKVPAAKEGNKYINHAMVFGSAPLAFAKAFSDLAWTKLTGRPTPASRSWADIQAMRAYHKAQGISDASGEPYVLIFEKHGLNAIAKAVEIATSTYKPNKDIENIVDEIAAQNIEQRYASNIGPRMFEVLNTKFKTKYQSTLLDKIALGKFVDYSQWGINPLDKSALPTSLASLGKPNDTYFKEFLAAYVTAKSGKECAVFIDDTLENVLAAAQEGMIAIHFDATKPNAQAIEELRKDLTELHILK